MTIKELLFKEIESTSEELLEETLDFLRFLKTKQIQIPRDDPDTNQPIQSTGRSLLEHLKTIGTWEGDDAEECLETIYATRGKAKFDNSNSFDE